VALFWQYLSRLLPRSLTFKRGLPTGWVRVEIARLVDPCFLPLLLRSSGDFFLSALNYLFSHFLVKSEHLAYMPLKSTLFRKIISPKSDEFAHLPANQVCPENYPKEHLYRDLKWVIWSLPFLSLFSGFFGSKQIVPLWIKDGNNREEAMMIFAQKVLWLLDYDEHGEASLDGVRVSTQPVCSRPFLLITWIKFIC